MKTYVGVNVQLHAFLTWELDGSERSASRPGRFTPGEEAPCTHWAEMGPRAGLHLVVKTQTYCSCRD